MTRGEGFAGFRPRTRSFCFGKRMALHCLGCGKSPRSFGTGAQPRQEVAPFDGAGMNVKTKDNYQLQRHWIPDLVGNDRRKKKRMTEGEKRG